MTLARGTRCDVWDAVIRGSGCRGPRLGHGRPRARGGEGGRAVAGAARLLIDECVRLRVAARTRVLLRPGHADSIARVTMPRLRVVCGAAPTCPAH